MAIEALTQASEATIRLSAFAIVFAAVACWEFIAPCRAAAVSKMRRWRNNLTLAVLNVVLIRVLFPLAAVGAAAAATANGWGFLNAVALPPAAAVPLAIVALDFTVWVQHRVFHAVPVLWRLHSVHHADVDFDVTTGMRFHPLEILLSIVIKMAVVVALGAPAVAVVAFEVILNATSLFNHANARLPPRIEHRVRWILVTPDMHRIHHSIEADEMNRNFGFNLSLWDRLFGTYREAPRRAVTDMIIGLPKWRGRHAVVGLTRLLGMPFWHEPAVEAADPGAGEARKPPG